MKGKSLSEYAFTSAIIAIILFIAGPTQAKVVYVSKSGSDSNDGLNWASAKLTVQVGLNAAAAGDQVWVASGTYSECIVLRNGVELYGGFAGGETQLDQRDWTANETILDGNASGSVVTAPGGRVNMAMRVDGFTIRNGSGTAYVDYTRGGGIWCDTSLVIISNNTITGNNATGSSFGYGGGIYCSSAGSATIINNVITGNKAEGGSKGYGGGIYCASSSSPTISGNIINGNSAMGMEGYGGGIHCDSSSASVSNNTISGNTATGFTGYGGGIYCSGSSPTIARNRIEANTAGAGGGVCCSMSSARLSNNLVVGNFADNGGGGVFSDNSPAVVSNNVIAANGSRSGGGISISGSDFSPAISNNTVVSNTASQDGGGVSFASWPAATVSNNIIAFNSSGLYGGSPIILRNNCVHNPNGYNYSGTAPGLTDIIVAPQLLGTTYGELHLRVNSPCIDAGDDTAIQPGWNDMDGEPRVQGAQVDIGADEFNGAAPAYAPRIVRVSTSGDDGNDGSTWTLAKAGVQAGIDAVVEAGGGEVWVAEGTYDERISLKTWAHVYGGFAGTETSRDQRDRRDNLTVLDGGAGGSVVTVSIIPGYLVSTVDGFTICNGSSQFSGDYRYGGGIYCFSSSPTISNNTVTGNTVSGGIYGYGGGISCMRPSRPLILNNAIIGNSVVAAKYAHGGGISCASYAVPLISNNKIVNNIADGSMLGRGGGIYCEFHSSPSIVNNSIAGNVASLSGGGIYCDGSVKTALSNSIIAFNSSGLHLRGPSTLRNNCVYNPDGENYTSVSPGIGDISLDPLFVDRAGGDFRLAAGSPCIDAGCNAALPGGTLEDMGGRPRFMDDPSTPDCQWSPGSCGTAPIMDMGAYEFIPLIVGDFDWGGYVNESDLEVFMACATGPGVFYDPFSLPLGCELPPDPANRIAADFNDDGMVDMRDFAALQRCWSGSMPADPYCTP